MDNFRAISVGGAYAYLLATGLQTYETRTWSAEKAGLTPGETILIHVPQSTDWDDSFAEIDVDPALCPKSSLIGAVRYVGEVDDGDGFYRHYYESPVLFPSPVLGVKGARRYWLPKTTEQKQAFKQAALMLPLPPIFPPSPESSYKTSPIDCAIYSIAVEDAVKILSEESYNLSLDLGGVDGLLIYGNSGGGEAYGHLEGAFLGCAFVNNVAARIATVQGHFFADYYPSPGYATESKGELILPRTVAEFSAISQMLSEQGF